jgi:GntR family transcriptional regulator, transcriptional repressor for pyruvate dehydrogenase complex
MVNQLRLSKISTADAVVNYIKERIEGGVFKPGEKLPSERLLQKELAVSRFTLREALARLSALGIIKTQPGDEQFHIGGCLHPIVCQSEYQGHHRFF